MGGRVAVLDWVLGAGMSDGQADQDASNSGGHLQWTKEMVDDHLHAFTRANIMQQAFNHRVIGWANAHASASHSGVWDVWGATSGTGAGAATVTTSEPASLLESEAYPGGALLHVLAFDMFDVLDV